MLAELGPPSSAPAPARTLLDLSPRAAPIEVVAIGASAGGVEALSSVVAHLPAEFPAPVLVVLHLSGLGSSVLPAILDRAGALTATVARDGETLAPGRVYVAPPAHHLTVEASRIRLSQGPRENGHRPAVDPLFRSVATYGPHAAGVILSGARDDGSAGLRALKLAGGLAIVQDPRDALYASMPRNAMTHVDVDAVLPVHQIGFALGRLAGHGGRMMPTFQGDHGDPVGAFPADLIASGRSSRFICPDCGGALFEFRAGTVDRFACAIGHAYSFQSLFEEQTQDLELALWTAIRSLEDRAVMLRRMQQRSHEAGGHRASQTFGERADDADDRAQAIRALLHDVSSRERGAQADLDSMPEPGP